MPLAKVTSLTLIVLLFAGCGFVPAQKNINGEWFAQLNNPDQSQAFWFSTQLSQAKGESVGVSGFTFAPTPPCFSSQTSQTATFSVSGHSGGFQTGAFAMTISTTFGTETENDLTLNGTRTSDGTISGSWTLSGLSGCFGNGSFSMTPPPLV
ncbi:MAG TPA: hypothetical protein VMH04_08395 [Candidatus Solibacter sp.]|nr:hypothetical protein [Candidatus Solibacter sp.]